MRATVTAVTLAAALLLTSCSSEPEEKESANVALWKAGTAVATLTADVDQEKYDPGQLVQRPGVISIQGDEGHLKIVLGRQALLADLAALKLELEKMPGVSNVQERIVAPVKG